MAAKLLKMNVIKQIFHLRLQGHSNGSIIRITGVAKNTVKKYLRLAEVSSHNLEQLIGWEDEQLIHYFTSHGSSCSEGRSDLEELLPYFEKELKRTGVTRWILWGEYRERYPEGYGYSRFCYKLQEYMHQKSSSAHFEHVPGDKVLVDFAGSKLSIVNRENGEIEQVEVFVGILGYSQFTYVEAVRSQKKQDFIAACANAVHYFGGSPKAIVCDNLKSAVDKACKYEPTVNEAFNDYANHYGMAVLPTRSYKPKDKAAVERAVNIAYSRIYAPLRNRTFFSIEELNEAIKEALLVHNQTRFQNKDFCRKELFEKEEKSTLKDLPSEKYEMKYYREVTVMTNGHVQLRDDFHYYSVPYRYTGKLVKLVYTTRHVIVYCQGEQIAFHMRNYLRHKYTTIKEHLASQNQYLAEWNSERFLSWAESIDPVVKECIKQVLEQRPHPEQAYKSCSGILALGKKPGKQELIAACKKAKELGVYSYTFIKRIITNGYAREGVESIPSMQTTLPLHENIRGASYYK